MSGPHSKWPADFLQPRLEISEPLQLQRFLEPETAPRTSMTARASAVTKPSVDSGLTSYLHSLSRRC